MIDKDYTLIIPTYNRPREFRALLSYLNNQKAEFGIRVLDSSSPEIAKENEKFISQMKLDIEFLLFPSDTPPFEKFWKGVQKIKTPFCSLCADDDVIVVKSIEKIIDFLKMDSSYVAAHGLYFSFMAQEKVTISDLVYNKDLLMDDDPIIRLRELFQSYEAITYAIYRTPILEKILSQVQDLDSLLGRELLGGALTAAMGKVKRLPLLYCGRSLSASHFYESWHPIEMLLTSPDNLYQEYGRYRKILVDTLKKSKTIYSEEDLYKLIDITHFSYMSEFLTENILEYLSNKIMDKCTNTDIMAGLWPIIIQNQKNSGTKLLGDRTETSFFAKRKLPFLKRALATWLTEFESVQFHILDEFKTKIHQYHVEKKTPLVDVLMTSMGCYFNALNDEALCN